MSEKLYLVRLKPLIRALAQIEDRAAAIRVLQTGFPALSDQQAKLAMQFPDEVKTMGAGKIRVPESWASDTFEKQKAE